MMPLGEWEGAGPLGGSGDLVSGMLLAGGYSGGQLLQVVQLQDACQFADLLLERNRICALSVRFHRQVPEPSALSNVAMGNGVQTLFL